MFLPSNSICQKKLDDRSYATYRELAEHTFLLKYRNQIWCFIAIAPFLRSKEGLLTVGKVLKNYTPTDTFQVCMIDINLGLAVITFLPCIVLIVRNMTSESPLLRKKLLKK